MKIEAYKGEIVHIIGGLSALAGELVASPHEETGWHRIKNPCITIARQEEDGTTIEFYAVGGKLGMYKRDFIDVYYPPDSVIEIRILDPEGNWYKSYKHEIQREIVRTENILTPDSPDFGVPPGVPGGKVVGAINNGPRKKRSRH